MRNSWGAVSEALDDLPDASRFVRLGDGVCHYRFDASADGSVVLLLHGATVPGWVFDRVAPYLGDAGLRVLCPDLYGHGYSDRPRLIHDYTLFSRQITELLDALSIDAPVHVLGHSLGAALAARLAASAPQRFGRLVLAAPLVDYASTKPLARLLSTPLLGECLMQTYVVPMLTRRRTRRYRDIEGGRFVAKVKQQLIRPGFGRALLSLIRGGALGDQSAAYRAIGNRDNPVLVLRGAEDTIVSARQIGDMRRLIPRAQLHEIAAAAHAFMLTHPERVAAAVVAFLTDEPGVRVEPEQTPQGAR